MCARASFLGHCLSLFLWPCSGVSPASPFPGLFFLTSPRRGEPFTRERERELARVFARAECACLFGARVYVCACGRLRASCPCADPYRLVLLRAPRWQQKDPHAPPLRSKYALSPSFLKRSALARVCRSCLSQLIAFLRLFLVAMRLSNPFFRLPLRLLRLRA